MSYSVLEPCTIVFVLHTDYSLLISFLQYIAFEIDANEEADQLAAPTKEQLDQEKVLLLAFKPVMQKFLHDHTDLQVSALYALQVHCNANAFPKGMYQLEQIIPIAVWK